MNINNQCQFTIWQYLCVLEFSLHHSGTSHIVSQFLGILMPSLFWMKIIFGIYFDYWGSRASNSNRKFKKIVHYLKNILEISFMRPQNLILTELLILHVQNVTYGFWSFCGSLRRSQACVGFCWMYNFYIVVGTRTRVLFFLESLQTQNLKKKYSAWRILWWNMYQLLILCMYVIQCKLFSIFVNTFYLWFSHSIKDVTGVLPFFVIHNFYMNI